MRRFEARTIQLRAGLNERSVRATRGRPPSTLPPAQRSRCWCLFDAPAGPLQCSRASGNRRRPPHDRICRRVGNGLEGQRCARRTAFSLRSEFHSDQVNRAMAEAAVETADQANDLRNVLHSDDQFESIRQSGWLKCLQAYTPRPPRLRQALPLPQECTISVAMRAWDACRAAGRPFPCAMSSTMNISTAPW